ncbi:uncharacterized protein EV420DRAFT_1524628 [Desarmillaria tabescens]|uniref:Uncharacterized protein n=1 Tax=Armillaria tabescens TaxID=1929756 RepID=A0AA39TPZ4_ARMTA|nr:uncharacterized protein EV420DRAFT_1524628 [Desarmillaria tabescens]KAK0462418.1 hypothetical protein EV420DRAFT_1524628 [Desarmillaria tabescens]
MTTLWYIITLFLLWMIWLAAITFTFFVVLGYTGWHWLSGVQGFGYIAELMLTVIEANIIFFMGYACFWERKHAKKVYDETQLQDGLHLMNTNGG